MEYVAPKLNLTASFKFSTQNIDSFLAITPVEPEKKRFYMATKRFGIPILGSYTFKGKQYTCS